VGNSLITGDNVWKMKEWSLESFGNTRKYKLNYKQKYSFLPLVAYNNQTVIGVGRTIEVS
jgi:hypothetical protein